MSQSDDGCHTIILSSHIFISHLTSHLSISLNSHVPTSPRPQFHNPTLLIFPYPHGIGENCQDEKISVSASAWARRLPRAHLLSFQPTSSATPSPTTPNLRDHLSTPHLTAHRRAAPRPLRAPPTPSTNFRPERTIQFITSRLPKHPRSFRLDGTHREAFRCSQASCRGLRRSTNFIFIKHQTSIPRSLDHPIRSRLTAEAWRCR